MTSTPYCDEEYALTVTGERHTFLMRSPLRMAKDSALLIHLAADWRQTLDEDPYRIVADRFLAAGFRVASFDLPNHGQRVNTYGEGLSGMATAMANGVDVIAEIVASGRALVEFCRDNGLVASRQIAVSGVSRGGLAALHLLAADDRIAGGVVFAPVTYLPALTEFAGLDTSPLVQRANACALVPRLTGRPLRLTIPTSDPRVGTEHCVALYDALLAVGSRQAVLDVVPGISHTVPIEAYLCGAAWLLEILSKGKVA